MKGTKRISLLLAIMMIFSSLSQPLAVFSAANNEQDLTIELETTEESLTESNLEDSEELADETIVEEIFEEEIVESEEQEAELEEEDVAELILSTVAPEDYRPEYNEVEEISLAQTFSLAEADVESENRVLLIEDVRPWNTNSNDRVLSGITAYDKVSTSQFLATNLANYAVIVFANDQPFNTYENYKDFKEHMETFAELGGVIVFGAADGGWSEGDLVEDLPGDVQKQSHYEYRNYVADQSHPIVTGLLTDHQVLEDDELYENYTSHTSFVESSLPVGSRVILRETSTDRPTLVEYPLEKGRVIASGLTWEYNYVNGGTRHPEGGRRGTYAQTAMKDLFEYAIRVSDISVEDVKVLEALYLETNQHHIVVSSKSTAQVISDAKIQIGDFDADLTDEKGMVSYQDRTGKQLVTVSKAGYRTIQQEYHLNNRATRFIFLEEDPGDGKPYFMRVQDFETGKDLRTETIHFTEGDMDLLRLRVTGDWGEHKEGTYYLYQEGKKDGAKGKQIVNQMGTFNFRPGIQFNPEQPVKLKMVSADGVESDPITIHLVINKADRLIDNGEGLNHLQWFLLAKDQVGYIRDNRVTSVFPGSFTIKAPFMPIEIEKEANDNGTVTWKGTIGIRGDNLLEDDSKWLTYKKDIKQMKTTGGSYANLDHLLYYSGARSGAFTVEKNLLNPTVNAVGYFEFTKDKTGKVIENDGGIIVSGGNKSVYTQQFLYGPVPLYLDLTGEVMISSKWGLGYSFEDEKVNYTFGEFAITPGIALGGGVGITGLATAGVEGGLELEIGLLPEATGELTAEASIKVQVLFVADWDYTIATTSFDLWGPKQNGGVRMASYRASADENELSLANRNYSEKQSDWNQAAPVMARFSGANQTDDVTILREWIMPNTLPKIAQVEDTSVMFFQSDDQERSIGNHTVLMYSVLEDGVWSDPLPVWESDTADLYYQSFESNDELYVIWQKSKAEVTATDAAELISELAENSEIGFAKWNKDTQKFEDQQLITDNESLDMYANLASNGDDLTAVWVNNSQSDPLGEAGTYSIMTSSLEEEGWSEPTVIHETTDYVTELSAGYVNESLTIAYSVQTNDGYSDLYLIEDGQVKQLTEADYARAIQFENRTFYWHSDGSVMVYDPVNQTTAEISPGSDQVITSSYQVISTEDQTAIVWHDGGEDQSTIYASFYQNGRWSEPISLTVSDDFIIQYMDVNRTNSGQWQLVINGLEYEEGEPKHSLIFVDQEMKHDIELTSVYADERLREGGIQPITFTVTNLGESEVNELTLKLENGEEIFEKKIATNIQSGETVFVTESFDLSSVRSETDFDVSVFTDGESDLANNEEALTLGLTNVSMEIKHYHLDDQIIVTATVANHSDTPTDVAIKIIEDSLDGLVLDMKNIGRLDNENDYVYIYAIDLDHVNYNEENSKYYYFEIETSAANLNEANETDLLVIYDEETFEISDEPIENLEIIPVTGVAIDQSQVSLVSGESLQLNAEVTPVDATIPNLKWETEDANVATVDQSGLLVARGLGTTRVMATTFDGEFVITVDVTVTEQAEDEGEVVVPEDDPEEPETPDSDLDLENDGNGQETEPGDTGELDDPELDEVEGSGEGETEEEAGVDESEYLGENDSILSDEPQLEDEDGSQTLANTATSMYNYFMIGLTLALLGGALYWINRRRDGLER